MFALHIYFRKIAAVNRYNPANTNLFINLFVLFSYSWKSFCFYMRPTDTRVTYLCWRDNQQTTFRGQREKVKKFNVRVIRRQGNANFGARGGKTRVEWAAIYCPSCCTGCQVTTMPLIGESLLLAEGESYCIALPLAFYSQFILLSYKIF